MALTWDPKLSDNVHDLEPETLAWLRQLGCRHAVFQPSARLQKHDRVGGGKPYWSTDDVAVLVKACAEAGVTLESVMLPLDFYPRALRGAAGRDEEIAAVCRTVEAVAAAGVPMMEWRFWPDFFFDEPVGVRSVPGRGGAISRAFDTRWIPAEPFDGIGAVGTDEMWERTLYFARPVVETAQAVGLRLSMHPNDPPVPVMRGVARIFSSPAGLHRFHRELPAEANGLTFCQGTFAEMGVDVAEQIATFGPRIRLVHLRAVTGRVPAYREVFIDEGDLDLFTTLRAYRGAGFDGPFVTDHTPGVTGDTRWGHTGRAFSLGWMRAAITALRQDEGETR